MSVEGAALAQFQRLFSDINLHVMSLRFGDFRVGTTDFVFVTWIHAGSGDGHNAAVPRVARQWVRPRSSAMSIDVALSTRRGVGRDTYSLPKKRNYSAIVRAH